MLSICSKSICGLFGLILLSQYTINEAAKAFLNRFIMVRTKREKANGLARTPFCGIDNYMIREMTKAKTKKKSKK